MWNVAWIKKDFNTVTSVKHLKTIYGSMKWGFPVSYLQGYMVLKIQEARTNSRYWTRSNPSALSGSVSLWLFVHISRRRLQFATRKLMDRKCIRKSENWRSHVVTLLTRLLHCSGHTGFNMAPTKILNH